MLVSSKWSISASACDLDVIPSCAQALKRKRVVRLICFRQMLGRMGEHAQSVAILTPASNAATLGRAHSPTNACCKAQAWLMEVSFAATLPTPTDKGRLLSTVHVADNMGWHRFVAVRTMAPVVAQLGDLNWKQLVSFIAGAALRKVGCSPQHYVLTDVLWFQIVHSANFATPDALMQYLVAWRGVDQFVSELLSGMQMPDRSSADLGSWLADYMNTVLYVALGNAARDAQYYVVCNSQVSTLADMTFACGSQYSKVTLGNMWETLA